MRQGHKHFSVAIARSGKRGFAAIVDVFDQRGHTYSMSAATDQIGVGQSVGDYEVIERLRSGGMATLFLGRRRGAAGFSRPVALKVVHPHLAEDQNFVQMFIDEALLSARIQHPNVVHVEELGRHQGTYFLAMEFVNGCSISQLIKKVASKRRQLSPEIAVHIAIKLCEGLHAAHETTDDEGRLLNVVHRDISPQNALVTFDGHVKLIDFGIAKAEGRLQETETGTIKGKFRYMAPEQARGTGVDRRSDIYAVGIVLWEMLTSRRWNGASTQFEAYRFAAEPSWRPPSEFAPELSASLDLVIEKALSFDADDRYPTALDLRRALANALPDAMLLDPRTLSELVRSLMREEAEEASARLKETSQVTHFGSQEAEQALQTLTVSASQVNLADFDVDGTPAAPKPAREIVVPADAKLRVSLDQVDRPRPPAVTDVVEAPPGNRKVLFGLLAVALLGLTIGGVLFFNNQDEEPNEAVHTEPLPETTSPNAPVPEEPPVAAAPAPESPENETVSEPEPETVEASVMRVRRPRTRPASRMAEPSTPETPTAAEAPPPRRQTPRVTPRMTPRMTTMRVTRPSGPIIVDDAF